MRIDPRIERALTEAEVSWELERGSKHYQLLINGKLVVILPASGRDYGSQGRNALAAVKRYLRGLRPTLER